jgi:hypothetical protein
MARNTVVLPEAIATAVDLIEARISHFQAPNGHNSDTDQSDKDFESGMVFGLREAEACIMQALVTANRAPQ